MTFLFTAFAVMAGLVLGRPTRALAFRLEPLVAVDIDNGEQVDLQREYVEGYVVVIGGRPNCPNTRNVVAQAQRLSQSADGGRCRFAVVDCDAKPEAFRARFGGGGTDRLRFYTSLHEAQGDDNPNLRWLWSQYRGCGHDASAITLPFVFLLHQGEYVACTNGPIDLAEFIRNAMESGQPSEGSAPGKSVDVYRLLCLSTKM